MRWLWPRMQRVSPVVAAPWALLPSPQYQLQKKACTLPSSSERTWPVRAGAGFESKVCLILRVPAFSSRRIEQLQESITRIVDGMLDRIEANGPAFDGMKDYGAHLVVDALLDAMVNMDERRKAIFVAFHDMIPGTTYVKPGEPWSPELRRAFARTMEEIKVIIDERRVGPRPDFISDLVHPAMPATSSTTANCSTRVSASAARRCRPPVGPPAVCCTCFTRTTTSGTN